MNIDIERAWLDVDTVVKYSKGIAFDTCHKIYVLMDDEQVALMESYGYKEIRKIKDYSPKELMVFLRDWYEDSCSLRFITSVETNLSDPNAGFRTLIEQGAEDEDGY